MVRTMIRHDTSRKTFVGQKLIISAGVTLSDCILLRSEIVYNAGVVERCVSYGAKGADVYDLVEWMRQENQRLRKELKEAKETAGLAIHVVNQLTGDK